MQSKSTKKIVRGEKEKFLNALNTIRKYEHINRELTFEETSALERCFEIIGGLLKDWVYKGLLDAKDDQIVTDAIRTRDKISHFYTGFDLNIAKEAIKDFDHIIKITEHIKD